MSHINHGLFSSKTGEWETPQALYDALDQEFKFTIDICATKENAKHREYMTKEQDALSRAIWIGRVWMNPPYGREIGRWMAKAYQQSQWSAEVVVCLVPARTDTAWWHDYCMKGEVRFLRGRLRFGNAKNSAPFPSAIVVFRKKP